MELNRKRIIIFIILIALTLTGVVVAVFNNFRVDSDSDSQSNPQNSVSQLDDYNVTQEEIATLEAGYINIKNFDDISPDSDPLVKQQAGSALYSLATNLKPEKVSYDGEIRQGTFTRTQFEDHHFKEKMIIDIPELRQSWGLITLWSRTIDSDHTDNHVYIVCLDKELLQFDEFECSTPYGKYEDY